MNASPSVVTCLLCPEPVGQKAAAAGYNYCRFCWACGAAETHRNRSWLAQVDPRVEVWQTGGGVMNPALVIKAADGTVVGDILLGIIGGDSPKDWDCLGAGVEAHPEGEWGLTPSVEWPSCPACQRIEQVAAALGRLHADAQDEITDERALVIMREAILGLEPVVIAESENHEVTP